MTAVDAHARRRLAAALLGDRAAPAPHDPAERVARGVLLDISPHMLSLATPRGEERFVFARSTTFWRGREVDFSRLRHGQDIIVRRDPSSRWVAERVWSDPARVTGVITARDGDVLEIDPGHDRERRTAVIPYRSSGRMRVRHSVLEPGYLFDAIGVWEDGVVQALLPATSQPTYPVAETPQRPPVRRRPTSVSGMVTWYDPVLGRDTHADPRATAPGAAYSALDRASDCGPECDRAASCAPLPLLSIGATLRLRSDCTGDSAAVPVTSCGSAVSHFCDRCVTCATEERGRIAQLTLAGFVALGGRLEDGCFNATLAVD
ncbi:hypothetical protein HDA32_005464 [Spinactinospora alkalitolerans]|uniref:Uncharacterized protein n=1 Tax=Spinactinospora alkalitolerans TaxID=687207 RepID=A0A852U8E1_9ACTN|nr:hypothetical protein [Spinactinospora alkalitolerans]NYE50344.1 hypothetical protein [Spinactinospora alkalitolerans]